MKDPDAYDNICRIVYGIRKNISGFVGSYFQILRHQEDDADDPEGDNRLTLPADIENACQFVVIESPHLRQPLRFLRSYDLLYT